MAPNAREIPSYLRRHSGTPPKVPPNPRFFCRALPAMLKEIFPTAVVITQSGAALRIIPPSPLRRLPRPAFPSPVVDVAMRHPKGPVIRRRQMYPKRILRRFGHPTVPTLRRIRHAPLPRKIRRASGIPTNVVNFTLRPLTGATVGRRPTIPRKSTSDWQEDWNRGWRKKGWMNAK